jgi:2-polyprenyl-3-methyl-5-hydroxy-6-metoxy-1,4-benzoquinol methylase
MINKFSFFINIYKKSTKKKFTKIFRNNSFLGRESKSGEGSGLSQTTVIRQEIPKLLKELRVKSLIDAPCGDLYWLKEIELPVEKYIGIDIVEELIDQNKKKYVNQQQSFMTIDIIEDEIPKADIILCRDCLVHLSFKQCIKVIKNFKKSGAIYVLTTTFTERLKNNDLGRGFWRTLNLEIPPFNFPRPIKIINENCSEYDGEYSDKSLGLWLLKDIHFD